MDARGCWASADGGDGFGTRGYGEERVQDGRGRAGKAEGQQGVYVCDVVHERSAGKGLTRAIAKVDEVAHENELRFELHGGKSVVDCNVGESVEFSPHLARN